MHRMLINRVGVAGVRFFPLYDKLIEYYLKDKIVMTTESDYTLEKFSDRVNKLIDYRLFFKDDVRYNFAKNIIHLMLF